MKTINKTIGLLFLGLLFTACGSGETINEHNGEEEHGHEEGGENTVAISQLQIKSIDLNLVELEEKNMSPSVHVNGTLEIPPQHKADISPIMGGIVKQIYVIEGDRVKKGQVLATLQHPDFIQLQNDYNTNINNFEYTEKEYFRQQKLNKEKVTSDKSFQKITAEYKNLKATVAAQKIKLQLLGLNVKSIEEGKIYASINITSPFNGFVSAVETNIGNYAAPLSRLFEIVNSDEMHADFMVYEKDINDIAIGQTVYFSTSSMTSEFSGKIHNISPVFETDPKALHVHVDIDETESKLIPGMYISGRIIIDDAPTTALPDHAVVQDQGKSYIFVQTTAKKDAHDHGNGHGDDDGHGHDEKPAKKDDGHGHGDSNGHDEGYAFEKIEVIEGISVNGYTEIKLLTPLKPHAKIAGNGAYFLLAEMGKGETEHEH